MKIPKTLARFLLVAVAVQLSIQAQDSAPPTQYKTDTRILYRAAGEPTDYMKERCRLDV